MTAYFPEGREVRLSWHNPFKDFHRVVFIASEYAAGEGINGRSLARASWNYRDVRGGNGHKRKQDT